MSTVHFKNAIMLLNLCRISNLLSSKKDDRRFFSDAKKDSSRRQFGDAAAAKLAGPGAGDRRDGLG
jgi:hypothetical protein